MINIKRKIIISVVFSLLVILSAGCQQNDKDVGALNDTKIIRAEEWKNQHPDIYASFMTNAEMKETKYWLLLCKHSKDYPDCEPLLQKLFEIVKPNNAYFGEKDFQQLQIVKKLVQKEKISVKTNINWQQKA